jgi:membrane-associated protease RseP (regulator of RpoE activity)
MFMGPAIVKWKKGETQYSIRCIPIGGFCAMEGEDEDTDNPRSFQKAAWWKRLIILVAGSFMNFVAGFLIMLIVFVGVVAMTRFVSLASVMCAFLYPILLRAFCPDGWVVLTGIATTAFVVFMHRENLKRLLNGTERKISFGKKKAAEGEAAADSQSSQK